MTNDLHLKPGTSWQDAYASCVKLAPEAFEESRINNLLEGKWQRVGTPGNHCVARRHDAHPLGPRGIDYDLAGSATAAAFAAHLQWGRVALHERKARVTSALDAMATHRDLLALLLVWEIGKPWRLARADVDRCIDGVRWYVENIDRQLRIGTTQERRPLPGPVSNIASWNYPMSVQVHAELVQALAGNAVVAKTPSQGGFHCLTLAHALMARAGLPVTLVSGVGHKLADALINSPSLGALVFVGGRANGRAAATALADTKRRHMLEQEGLNAWGVWEFGQWEVLAQHLRKGFEYAKQRCTAYPRYVVQRKLLPRFLETILPVMAGLKFGHPLAVERRRRPRLSETRLRSRHLGQEGQRARQGLRRGSRGARATDLRALARPGAFPRGSGHLGVRRAGVRPRTRAELGAAPGRALRSARLDRLRRHGSGVARGDEREQRRPHREPRHRQP